MNELTLTIILEEAEEGGFIGYVAELPGANTQGETLKETRENLMDAIEMLLEVKREETEQRLAECGLERAVVREQIKLRAA